MVHRTCFCHNVPVLKRHEFVGCEVVSQRNLRHLCTKRAHHFVARKGRSAVRMTLQDRVASSRSQSSILPNGVFTVVLWVTLHEGLLVKDQKVMLTEYGRKACAEPGVLRCDVLYEVSKTGKPRDRMFQIWISFSDSKAYIEHEKTAHAAKLRLCLQNPLGGDNSVVLTKLAHNVELLRPVWPEVDEWRSPFEYSNSPSETKSSSQYTRPTASEDYRRSLSMLISSVGLENVNILIASASATSMDSSRKLRKAAEGYLKFMEKFPGTVRTMLLIDKNDPFRVTLMSVHDPSDEDGACFDMELASEHISDDGWDCRRCSAVFPDKVGWEKPLNEEMSEKLMGTIPDKKPKILPTEEMRKSLPESTGKEDGGSGLLELVKDPEKAGALQRMSKEESRQSAKMRFIQGPEAFDSLKRYIREITKIETGDVHLALISGWNGARLHFIITQVEYNARTDPGMITFNVGPQVMSTEVSTEAIRKGVMFVRKEKPDLIIGNGGGSVMDYVKTIGKFANMCDEELEKVLGEIDDAAERELDQFSIVKTAPPFPIMLFPSNVGNIAVVTEPVILAGRKKNGEWHRMYVDILDEEDFVRQVNEKTVLIDSRLVSPRRLLGKYAGPEAIQLICHAIDYFISMHEHPREEGMNYALSGLVECFRQVLPALREPEKASGQTRDPLVNARAAIALAADTVGRLGICVRTTIAVLDACVDGREPLIFRTVFIRLTIAFLEELCELQSENDGALFIVMNLSKVTKTESGRGLVKKLLENAEDCDVWLLREMGVVRRLVPEIAARVRNGIAAVSTSALERLFVREGRLEKILYAALDQDFEL